MNTPCPVSPDVALGLSVLFESDMPNSPMALSVLEGRNPGQVFVDDPEKPQGCVIRTNYTFTFVVGAVDQEFLDHIVTRCRDVLLVWPLDRRPDGIRPPDRCAGTADRLAFSGLSREDRHCEELLGEAPADCLFRPMDAELVGRCWWIGEVLRAFVTVERFLESGRGFCLMRGDEILAEAYGLFQGGKRVEVAVYTPSRHRGQGYGTLAAAYLTQQCAAERLETYWSCHQSNLASQGVARKLGYRRMRPYELHYYTMARPKSPSRGD